MAFRRFDMKWFNRPWLFLCCHLILVKAVLFFLSLFMCWASIHIGTIGLKKGDPIRGARYCFVRFFLGLTGYIVLFCGSSNLWMNWSKPKCCYKKYLGPDWEPDYNRKNVSCIISNHTSSMDGCTISMQ